MQLNFTAARVKNIITSKGVTAMKIFLNALIMFVFALNISVANAEIITVEGTGRYVIDKNLKETFADATEHARDEAMRAASEKAGVLVKSHSRAVDLELDEDVIETFAVSLLENVQKVDSNNINAAGDIEFICHVTATVDTSKIDIEKFLKRDDFSEKERLTKELREARAEIERLKAQSKTGNDAQRQKFQNEFDRKQNKFLIAKYERDLDIYDFGKKINLQDMMTTAEKLAALDAGNSSAFRATVYVYRHEDKIQNVVDYCKEMLDANTSADISIEACAQLGDIYYNEIFDTPTAKKYVDQGIALVKKKYSKAQIEKLVNGTNVEIKDLELIGRSNTIRELYILKSDIENINPKFDSVTVMKDLGLDEDKIYNIKYRTNW